MKTCVVVKAPCGSCVMKNGEFRAIYEDGVFKPIDTVTLGDRTEVIVRPAAQTNTQRREAAKKRVFESLARSYETGISDLASRHNEFLP